MMKMRNYHCKAYSGAEYETGDPQKFITKKSDLISDDRKWRFRLQQDHVLGTFV